MMLTPSPSLAEIAENLRAASSIPENFDWNFPVPLTIGIARQAEIYDPYYKTATILAYGIKGGYCEKHSHGKRQEIKVIGLGAIAYRLVFDDQHEFAKGASHLFIVIGEISEKSIEVFNQKTLVNEEVTITDRLEIPAGIQYSLRILENALFTSTQLP